ncbi:hypothetical protein ADUPG1_009675 [Aduncisulcus paluster]|uniref:PHD-type domain-containing protein n=1 Tax=Aduncisulcus paluster TaxID=2918883 RepID=A0ABQ5KXL8_9EUKA|nr:hypothetical protein ADUPG1_009675 [Aduncisulcus paluster]
MADVPHVSIPKDWDVDEILGAKASQGNDNEFCHICRSVESEDPNLLVFCSGCGCCVHVFCADIPEEYTKSEDKEWFCPACTAAVDVKKLTCEICGQGGWGYYVPAVRHRGIRKPDCWVHKYCSSFYGVHAEPVDGIIQLYRLEELGYKKLQCAICKKKTGFCIQCQAVSKCAVSFHPMCAVRQGWITRQIRDPEHPYTFKLIPHCGKHTDQLLRDGKIQGKEKDRTGTRKKRAKPTSLTSDPLLSLHNQHRSKRHAPASPNPFGVGQYDINSEIIDVDEFGESSPAVKIRTRTDESTSSVSFHDTPSDDSGSTKKKIFIDKRSKRGDKSSKSSHCFSKSSLSSVSSSSSFPDCTLPHQNISSFGIRSSPILSSSDDISAISRPYPPLLPPPPLLSSALRDVHGVLCVVQERAAPLMVSEHQKRLQSREERRKRARKRREEREKEEESEIESSSSDESSGGVISEEEEEMYISTKRGRGRGRGKGRGKGRGRGRGKGRGKKEDYIKPPIRRLSRLTPIHDDTIAPRPSIPPDSICIPFHGLIALPELPDTLICRIVCVREVVRLCVSVGACVCGSVEETGVIEEDHSQYQAVPSREVRKLNTQSNDGTLFSCNEKEDRLESAGASKDRNTVISDSISDSTPPKPVIIPADDVSVVEIVEEEVKDEIVDLASAKCEGSADDCTIQKVEVEEDSEYSSFHGLSHPLSRPMIPNLFDLMCTGVGFLTSIKSRSSQFVLLFVEHRYVRLFNLPEAHQEHSDPFESCYTARERKRVCKETGLAPKHAWRSNVVGKIPYSTSIVPNIYNELYSECKSHETEKKSYVVYCCGVWRRKERCQILLSPSNSIIGIE